MIEDHTKSHIVRQIATMRATIDEMEDLLIQSPDQDMDGWPAPGPYSFSNRSLRRMQGVHPDLVAVAHFALRVSTVDFLVTRTGGVRTEEMQRELVSKGASKTMNSRHLTGHALDVVAWVDGKVDWSWQHCITIHKAFAMAGRSLAVVLRWGGDWDGDGDTEDQKFRDGYHHELTRSVYGTQREAMSSRAEAFLEHVADAEAQT